MVSTDMACISAYFLLFGRCRACDVSRAVPIGRSQGADCMHAGIGSANSDLLRYFNLINRGALIGPKDRKIPQSPGR